MYSEVLWRIFAKLGGCICRLTSHLPLRGSFSKRSTASRVNGSLSLSTILYRDQPNTTQLQRHLLVIKQQSNLAPFAVVHVNDVCRWTWQLLLRGSFSKTSTGRRGDWSTGQRVTFTFAILYMIADDARLKPPRCKKHTASFARSTGKFPSVWKYWERIKAWRPKLCSYFCNLKILTWISAD